MRTYPKYYIPFLFFLFYFTASAEPDISYPVSERSIFPHGSIPDRDTTIEFGFYAGMLTIDDILVTDVNWRKDENVWEHGDLNMSFSDSFVIGLHMQYNYNNHLALCLDVDYSQPRYTGEWNGGTIAKHANVLSVQIGGVLNLLEGPFTPYLSAGVGGFYLNTRIPDADPEWVRDSSDLRGGYWEKSSRDEFYFSAHAAVGIRWDFHKSWTAFMFYSRSWLDVNSVDGNTWSDKFCLGINLRL